jgi:hypothetical protein
VREGGRVADRARVGLEQLGQHREVARLRPFGGETGQPLLEQ